MQNAQRRHPAHAETSFENQYTSRHSERHRSYGSVTRLIFFCLTSVWGYVIGIIGFFAAIGVEGQGIARDVGVLPRLIPSFLLAAVGSFVLTMAYKEASRRSRR